METPEVIPNNRFNTWKKKHPMVSIVVVVAAFLALIALDMSSRRFDLVMAHVGLLSFVFTLQLYPQRLELQRRWLYRVCAIVGIVSFASSVIFMAMR